MEFGIFNLMGARDPATPTGQIFGEVAEQTKRADELGYTIAWFAEHHFSNYCMCASPLMMVAHCAANTRNIRLGTAVVVVPLFSYDGKHYKMPSTHIAARPVQKPLPIYVAGHTQAMFRAAARHGYRVLSSGRLGGEKLLAGQYADMVTAFAAENVPVERAHMTVNRFAHITNSRDEGMRFAENARYQSRLAASLRHRQEVMQGTALVDVPYKDEPPLETIHNDLLIGDPETVAEKLVREIRATKPVHMCFSFKVGNTPHKAAMRSMELMIGEVKPRVEKALATHA